MIKHLYRIILFLFMFNKKNSLLKDSRIKQKILMLKKQLINLSVDLNSFYWSLMCHQNHLSRDETFFNNDYMNKNQN
jgi:hypothetical protein